MTGRSMSNILPARPRCLHGNVEGYQRDARLAVGSTPIVVARSLGQQGNSVWSSGGEVVVSPPAEAGSVLPEKQTRTPSRSQAKPAWE
jgi:hypothetical protein